MRTRLLTCLAAICVLACSNDETTSTGTTGSSSKSTTTSSSTSASGGSGGTGTGGTGTGGTGGACPTSADPIELTSTAVMEMGLLPAQYKCGGFTGGMNISPPLAWTPGPAGTLSYAILFRDITPNQLLPHSVIWDIPACTLELPEDVEKTPNPAEVPGAKQGHAYNSAVGYEGPCYPPDPNPRTYQFELYAIDVATITELTTDSTVAAAEPVLEGHSLASDTLTVIEDEP